MEINEEFAHLADDPTIERTRQALEHNGITTFVVDAGAEAKAKVIELIPAGAQIMNMTSMTLENISVVKEILETDRFTAIRHQLNALSDDTEATQKRQLGAAPPWSVSSVHAVTEAGQVLIASNTGSQLPASAYGAQHVVWVVGTHKIVRDLQTGLKRLYEYSLPLEDARARQAYGTGSNVSKILIINKEVQPGRITLIFVKEKLGF